MSGRTRKAFVDCRPPEYCAYHTNKVKVGTWILEHVIALKRYTDMDLEGFSQQDGCSLLNDKVTV